MSYLLLSVILGILLPLLLAKVIIWLVSWQLTRKFSIKFKVKSIGFFNLNSVSIDLPNDAVLTVSRIAISSNLISSKCRSNLSITIEGVEVISRCEAEDLILSATRSRSQSGSSGSEIVISDQPEIEVEDYLSLQLQQLSQRIKSCLQPITWSIDLSSFKLITSHFELSISSIDILSEASKVTLICKSSKIESIVPMTDSELNLSPEGSRHKILLISFFRLIQDFKDKENRFEFGKCPLDETYLEWTPMLHLTAINLFSNLSKLTRTFKSSLGNRKSKSPNSSPTHLNPRIDSNSTNHKIIFVNFKGNIELGALVSNSGNKVCLRTSSGSLISQKVGKWSFENPRIFLHCDNHLIGTFDRIRILMLPDNESSKFVKRNEFIGANFIMNKNRLCLIAIDKINISFPYKYNFAETFNEKFISITKWLRKLHSSPTKVEPKNVPESKSKKVPESKSKSKLETSSSKLDPSTVAADMCFNIKELILELEDDPFEVKLRNNYELLEDEYKENMKRQQTLIDTISKLRMNMVVSDKVVKKMKDDLEMKRHEIYIQRHRATYQNTTTRSNIFTVIAEDINMKLAADLSLTGHDRLIKIMKCELDPVSPFPEDLKFSNMWCRQIIGSIGSLICRLRNFPQPMMSIDNLSMTGRLMGAEQEASSRSKRTVNIDILPGISPMMIERTMPTHKLYHDMKWKVIDWNYTHGATWEPVLAQLSINFESVIKPSNDPSPTLPWWDKFRFIFHGNLIVEANQLSLLFHGSLDPYNSTELIEVSFNRSKIDWLTGKIQIRGNVDLLVHTASKYDECRIVHLPNIEATIYLNWECLGNPYDHHSVTPCASNKCPEYTANIVHDSYRAFRSQHLDIKLSLESKSSSNDGNLSRSYLLSDIPSVLLFSSSLRWFESTKQVFAGITRLTRRGKFFGNIKPRKKPFSRLFRKIRVSLCLHRLKTMYWSSFNRTIGFEVIGGHLSHSAEHTLSLVPYDDGLHRRPRPIWTMTYQNSEISDVEIWLQNNKIPSSAEEDNSNTMKNSSRSSSGRLYLLSFSRVSYNRENKNDFKDEDISQSPPTHRLVVHDLKGAWTKENKDVTFSLFDLFMNAQSLKRNLSTEALKGFQVKDSSNSSDFQENRKVTSNSVNNLTSSGAPSGNNSNRRSNLSGSKSSLNKNHAASMLKKLIAESESNPHIVYSEDVESELISDDEVKLRGVSGCSDDDVIMKNWLIELVNSQVILRGCETKGYVIASAAKCQIWQKIHRPVWKDLTPLAKKSWVGSVHCMQYYATVDARIDSDMVWLGVDNIEQQNMSQNRNQDNDGKISASDLCGHFHTASTSLPTNIDLGNLNPDVILDPTFDNILSTGQSVGGVVSSLVNPSEVTPDYQPFPSSGLDSTNCVQLQRIISRCDCQFYYVGFSDDLDMDIIKEIPPRNDDDDLLEPWDKEIAVDSFTLMHHELEVSTNSQQFAMIIDLVNNLLLYVEPHRKEAVQKMMAMKFQFQLSSLDDQRPQISMLQDILRKLIRELKSSEKECYKLQRIIEETEARPSSSNTTYISQCHSSQGHSSQTHSSQSYLNSNSAMLEKLFQELELEKERSEKLKCEIAEKSDDLALRITCFKEAQIIADKDRERQEALASGRFVSSVVKRIEVCFKQADWVLTDADGQIALADLSLSNFLYNKVAKNDDSVEHSLELGYIRVKNRLPNQAYETVLMPTELSDKIPLDRRRALRIFCRERAPVAGISVKEHFEVNVVPITIAITKAFFKRMLKFFFPDPEIDPEPVETTYRRLHWKRNRPNKNQINPPIEVTNDNSSDIATASTNSSGPSTISSLPSGSKNETSSKLSTGGRNVTTVSTASTSGGSDIEKMRERAQKNQTFVYIKIPEVPIRVSYKGSKSKNIEDINNFSLILPTIEYHNQTWTWLDVLMAIKNESQRRLLSQAVKQKLHIPRPSFLMSKPQAAPEDITSPTAKELEQVEDRKARLLLGDLAVPTTPTKSRLSVFFGSHKK